MMKRRGFAKLFLGLATAGGVLGGTEAMAQTYPGNYGPVPPRQYEVVPVAPGPGYVWRPGHWFWNGHRYLWIRGAYIIRQPHWHHWVDGHWVRGPGGWVWIDGHWG
jgi:hypothetical protein